MENASFETNIKVEGKSAQNELPGDAELLAKPLNIPIRCG